MRKIFFISLLMVIAGAAHAQFNTMQFSPATFTADDSVVFTIDLTGTPLDGETDLYIWTWTNSGSSDPQYPSRDGITNTSWGNSPASARMTHISGNKWSFGMVGSNIYGLQPGQLKYFQFLVKTKTGSKQTSDSPKYGFAPVSYVPSTYRLFPSRISKDDVVTIYFYQNLSSDMTESRMTPATVTVTLSDSTGAQVGSPVTLQLRSAGQQLYAASFHPGVAWTLLPAVWAAVKKFTYVVNGTSYDTNGNRINVSGSSNTRVFDGLQ